MGSGNGHSLDKEPVACHRLLAVLVKTIKQLTITQVCEIQLNE